MSAQILFKSFVKNIMSKAFGLLGVKTEFPVFLTHAVLSESPGNSESNLDYLTEDAFESQLIFLKRHFDVISLNSAFEAVQNGESLKGKCAVTFDDGYACVAKYAFPILEKHNIPATVFIISNIVDDKTPFWRDQIRMLQDSNKKWDFLRYIENQKNIRVQDLNSNLMKLGKKVTHGPTYVIQKLLNDFFEHEEIEMPNLQATGASNAYMTSNEIRNSPPIIEFGNHTASHPLLPSLSIEKQIEEIEKCKVFLDGFSNSAPLFCLPFGAYDEASLKAARYAGYSKIIFHENEAKNSISEISNGKIKRLTFPSNTGDLAFKLIRA